MSESRKGGNGDLAASPQQPLRVLPDDVYYTLLLSAEAYGGVGAVMTHHRGQPLCALGQLADIAVSNPDAVYSDRGLAYFDWRNSEIGKAVHAAGITTTLNDWALVRDVPVGERIPFEEWCRRLNVVPASAVAERSEAK